MTQDSKILEEITSYLQKLQKQGHLELIKGPNNPGLEIYLLLNLRIKFKLFLGFLLFAICHR